MSGNNKEIRFRNSIVEDVSQNPRWARLKPLLRTKEGGLFEFCVFHTKNGRVIITESHEKEGQITRNYFGNLPEEEEGENEEDVATKISVFDRETGKFLGSEIINVAVQSIHLLPGNQQKLLFFCGCVYGWEAPTLERVGKSGRMFHVDPTKLGDSSISFEEKFHEIEAFPKSAVEILPLYDGCFAVRTLEGNILLFNSVEGKCKLLGVPKEGYMNTCMKVIREEKVFVVGGHCVGKERTYVQVYDFEKEEKIKEDVIFMSRRSLSQFTGSMVEAGSNKVALVILKPDHPVAQNACGHGRLYDQRLNFLTSFESGGKSFLVCGIGNGIHLYEPRTMKLIRVLRPEVMYPEEKQHSEDRKSCCKFLRLGTSTQFIVFRQNFKGKTKNFFLVDFQPNVVVKKVFEIKEELFSNVMGVDLMWLEKDVFLYRCECDRREQLKRDPVVLRLQLN